MNTQVYLTYFLAGVQDSYKWLVDRLVASCVTVLHVNLFHLRDCNFEL